MARTPLYDWHVENDGRIVDFAGWEMPVQYSSIVDEHNAVRQHVGLFDISHMGRLFFRGPQAVDLLDHLLTNDVTKLKVGQIRYALVTNESGGILDDVLVYRFDGFYVLVVNASNRSKIVSWIESHQSGFDVEVRDETLDQAMIAVQGPAAVELLAPHVDGDIAAMKYYTGCSVASFGVDSIVSRTGYTGEDGYEIIVKNEAVSDIWSTLLTTGADRGVLPAGLGARDTLRLEAAMPLYGHEMDEETNPLEAGLRFAVKLKAGDFIGKAALLRAADEELTRVRIGLRIEGRRPAREGCKVQSPDGEEIGVITSGTFSPTLQAPIAMALVDARWKTAGAKVAVDIRGKTADAEIVDLPFYKRSQS